MSTGFTNTDDDRSDHGADNLDLTGGEREEVETGGEAEMPASDGGNGYGATGYGATNLDLTGGEASSEVVAELRQSLGGIAEVVQLHGSASGEALKSSGDDSISTPDMPPSGEQPSDGEAGGMSSAGEALVHESGDHQLAASGGALGGTLDLQGGDELQFVDDTQLSDDEDADEDEEEDGDDMSWGDLMGNLATSNGQDFEAARSELEAKMEKLAHYVPDELKKGLTVAARLAEPKTDEAYKKATDGMAKISATLDKIVEVGMKFDESRQRLDVRIARMAKFLPDGERVKLDEAFTAAVKPAARKTPEAFAKATSNLTRLEGIVDKFSNHARDAEAKHLKERIEGSLKRDGAVLVSSDYDWYVAEFAKLDVDLATDDEQAKAQVEELGTFAAQLDEAIAARIKAISDLSVDYDRLRPIMKRALEIECPDHAALEQSEELLRACFKDGAGGGGKDRVEFLQEQIRQAEQLVQKVFASFQLQDAVQQQSDRLPADPASLSPVGAALGKGEFGEVFTLASDKGPSLVGKAFSSTDAKAKQEMEMEAENYARIGSNPNIASCYGIHEVGSGADAKSMLVMQKIDGPDVGKVFKKLDERYRTNELTRDDYLAGVQHLIKGTLMGLAHMESMGIVHKDIKGDNIKFDSVTQEPVLIDMGLAQSEGDHVVKKACLMYEPPENRVKRQRMGEPVVKTVWDSFSVGVMLFEEMERDQSGESYSHLPGQEPVKKSEAEDHLDVVTGKRNADNTAWISEPGARSILGRNADGDYEATTDAQGQLAGQVLKPAESAEQAAAPGKFGADTEYVDFMNRLMHPDPERRMTPSEALKHPFMSSAMSAEDRMEKIFGPKAPSPTAQGQGEQTDKKYHTFYDNDNEDEGENGEDAGPARSSNKKDYHTYYADDNGDLDDADSSASSNKKDYHTYYADDSGDADDAAASDKKDDRSSYVDVIEGLNVDGAVPASTNASSAYGTLSDLEEAEADDTLSGSADSQANDTYGTLSDLDDEMRDD